MSSVTDKHKMLLTELATKISRELSLAGWSHWLNVAAMFLTVATTGIAVVYGLMANHTSQITAALALVPGGIALLATSLKLEARCNWHYRKAYMLEMLARKLRIELPDEPTQDQLSEVSHALGSLELESEAKWEETVSFDWKRFHKGD